MTTGKVLKERRAPRDRGRMGSSLTCASFLLISASFFRVVRLFPAPRSIRWTSRVSTITAFVASAIFPAMRVYSLLVITFRGLPT